MNTYETITGVVCSKRLLIGVNQVEIERGLTTSSTAVFVPFTTQELFQGGEALYYGLNALSNNMIMVDRKQLKNPNGLILGTPGSGKSFSAKREMTNAFLITEDDIIVCDPEAEYFPLVQKLGGQVIRISPVSTDYINPLDINTNYSEEENPLTLKSDFILSMCELIVGGKDGLQPVEKTIIDRSVRMVYQEFLADPKPEKMPILEDLYNILRNQKEPEAQRIATALEIYVHGSLNVFNHRTNVDVNNRFVCYDIRELGKQLKKLGMLIVQDQVWNRVTARGDDDFTPFRNIMNEYYARDTSRKIRSTFQAKGKTGKHLTGLVIYGYLWNETRDQWLVDEYSAEVVKRIFSMTIEGMGPYQIANRLKEEKVLIPSAYLAQFNEGVNKNKTFKDVYGWGSSTICNILDKREYLGHTINFKTRKHFKDKKSHYVPEDEWTIFENTHEAIIDQETFDLAQKVRSKVTHSLVSARPSTRPPISCVSISARPQQRRWRTKSSVCFVMKSVRCELFVNLIKKSLTIRFRRNG